MSLPYEHPKWREIMGDALHPGGTSLSRRLVCLCSFPKGSFILDAGCGLGLTLELLIENGFNALGLDRSDDMLKHARYRGIVVKGDLQQIPFEDASFDGVICECVLSQQKDPNLVLAELARVLKKGGILGTTDIFSVNDDYMCQNWNGSCEKGARSLNEMERSFIENGFEVLFFEDHPKQLRECTARLIWADIIAPPANSCRSLSYGLWICRRTESQKASLESLEKNENEYEKQEEVSVR